MRELHLQRKSNDKPRPRFDYFEWALSYRIPTIFWNGELEMGMRKCMNPEFPEFWVDGDGACDLKIWSVSVYATRQLMDKLSLCRYIA
jgi:hypothetical protein